MPGVGEKLRPGLYHLCWQIEGLFRTYKRTLGKVKLLAIENGHAQVVTEDIGERIAGERTAGGFRVDAKEMRGVEPEHLALQRNRNRGNQRSLRHIANLIPRQGKCGSRSQAPVGFIPVCQRSGQRVRPLPRPVKADGEQQTCGEGNRREHRRLTMADKSDPGRMHGAAGFMMAGFATLRG